MSNDMAYRSHRWCPQGQARLSRRLPAGRRRSADSLFTAARYDCRGRKGQFEKSRPAQIMSLLRGRRGKSVVRCKRKSDRERRSSVVPEDQRSSSSTILSELQDGFRRCHSDSEFRSLFIANCQINRVVKQKPRKDRRKYYYKIEPTTDYELPASGPTAGVPLSLCRHRDVGSHRTDDRRIHCGVRQPPCRRA